VLNGARTVPKTQRNLLFDGSERDRGHVVGTTGAARGVEDSGWHFRKVATKR
jgi:hypothetical protein